MPLSTRSISRLWSSRASSNTFLAFDILAWTGRHDTVDEWLMVFFWFYSNSTQTHTHTIFSLRTVIVVRAKSIRMFRWFAQTSTRSVLSNSYLTSYKISLAYFVNTSKRIFMWTILTLVKMLGLMGNISSSLSLSLCQSNDPAMLNDGQE